MTTVDTRAGYPLDAAARLRRRQRIFQREMEQARVNAGRADRSVLCGTYGRHAPDGCGNDGSSCICDCHDRTIV